MTDLFLAIGQVMQNPILSSILAILFGPLATFGLYWLLNKLVALIPNQKFRNAVEPYAFIGVVLLLVGGLLVGPTIQTVIYSFFKFVDDEPTDWIGLGNYFKLFEDPNFLYTVRNNLLWVAVVPAVTIILGLFIATLTDKLGKAREQIFKSIIFMPMAISFVAASSIWRLNYMWDAGDTQIGTLNAIIKALGGTPVNWIQTDTFALNSLALMVIVIWANAGFAMTLLSAAVKAAKASDVATLIHINSDPLIYSPSGEGWWDVPIAEVSTMESTQKARSNYEEALKKQDLYLGRGSADRD